MDRKTKNVPGFHLEKDPKGLASMHLTKITLVLVITFMFYHTKQFTLDSWCNKWQGGF